MSKRYCLASVAYLILATICTAGWGQDINAKGLFEKLDTDGDGRLTAEEVGQQRNAMFARILRVGDDGDGELTIDEFTAALQPVRAAKAEPKKQDSTIPGADALLVLLARMDANGDRRLMKYEIPDELLPMFQQMLKTGDADKNNRLDVAEIARTAPRLARAAAQTARRLQIDVPSEYAKLSPRQRAAYERGTRRTADVLADKQDAKRLFQRLDQDGDGAITSAELPQAMRRQLSRADRNSDEQLSESEFLAAAQRIGQLAQLPAEATSSRQIVRRALEQLDTDGDGAISKEEAPRRISQGFGRADVDQDGRLSREELQRISGALSRLRQMRDGETPD